MFNWKIVDGTIRTKSNKQNTLCSSKTALYEFTQLVVYLLHLTVIIPPLPSTKYLVMCKVYTDVGGINSYTMFCPPVRKIIHSLKLVDYLHVQADNPWYNYYLIVINWKYKQSTNIYGYGKKLEPRSHKTSFQVGVFYQIYQQHFRSCLFIWSINVLNA